MADDNLKPWAIKGVERDTRTALKKAARKSNKTLGEYFNTVLREVAQSDIKSKPQPPAKLDDMEKAIELLKGDRDRISNLEHQLQALNDRPATLREFIFGKKKRTHESPTDQ